MATNVLTGTPVATTPATFATPPTSPINPSDVQISIPFSDLSSAPKINGTMSTPVAPPVPTSPVGTALSYSDMIKAQLEADKKTQTETQMNDKAARDAIYKELGLGAEPGLAERKATDQIAFDQANDVTGKRGVVTSLRNQILSLEATNTADKLAVGQKVGGITTGERSGFESEIERNNAIKRLNLTAQLYAAEGDEQTAIATSKQALDAKYGPEEARLASIKEFYTMNKDVLTREDAKAAKEQETRINASIKDLEEKKKDEEDISNMIIKATPNAPQDVIARATKVRDAGGTPDQVAVALGEYGGDYLQNKVLKANLAKIELDMKKTRAEIAQIDTKTSLLNPQANGVVTAPNGDAIGLPVSTLSAIGKLKMNEGQSNAVAFVSRMIQSDKAIQQQLGKVNENGGFYETTGYDPTSVGSGFGRLVGSDKSRTYEINSADFIRAKLRKESGATISPEEMEADSKIYTPAGMGLDEKDLQLAQTKRDEAIKSMIAQAGPAAPYLLQYYENSKKTNEFMSDNPELNAWYAASSKAKDGSTAQTAGGSYGFSDNQ
jgi:hypothetical protein